jgi:sphingosine kinase
VSPLKVESLLFCIAKVNLIRQLQYFKAHAYRVKPLEEKGIVSVDGEQFPFEEFQVEVHPGLATLLSPYGRYAADFGSTPPSGRRHKEDE